MRHRLLSADPGRRTFVVVLDAGEEAIASIIRFAREMEIGTASVSGIGAFERAHLGFFDPDVAAGYRENRFDEQVEVLSIVGNVAHDGDAPSPHLHVTLGRADGSAVGGHLIEGVVRPTLELIIEDNAERVPRRHEPSGLTLLEP